MMYKLKYRSHLLGMNTLFGLMIVLLAACSSEDSSIPDPTFENPPPMQVVSNLPDTGLKDCYNNDIEIQCPSDGEEFYGQNSQYSSNQLSYTNLGEYVQDNVTGLMWKLQYDQQPYNWYEATGEYHDSFNPNSVDVCGSLSLGSYNDWRVPSRREFSTIFYFGAEEPGLAYLSVEPAVLANRTLRFWTSSEHRNVDWAWAAWGIAYGGMNAAEKKEFNIALCVRGPAWGNSVFVDNLDGTVTDQANKLMWQREEDGIERLWKDALLYCHSTTLAGYDDWRLPNVKELEALIKHDGSLLLDTAYFPNTSSDTFWSSTTAWEGLTSAGSEAFIINFLTGGYSGYEFDADKDAHYHFTRCVR